MRNRILSRAPSVASSIINSSVPYQIWCSISVTIYLDMIQLFTRTPHTMNMNHLADDLGIHYNISW